MRRSVWPKKFAGIFASVGVHPHDAGKIRPGDFEALLLLAAHPKAVAWGEIGLDYHYDHSPRDVQREMFRRQIGLARKAGLPVVIHTREADADTLAVLREEKAGELGGVFHCFSGDENLGPGGARHGIPRFLLWDHYVQESRWPSGHCPPRSAGPSPRGDGRSFPRARALPGEAKRAGARCASGGLSGRSPRRFRGGGRPRYDRERREAIPSARERWVK